VTERVSSIVRCKKHSETARVMGDDCDDWRMGVTPPMAEGVQSPIALLLTETTTGTCTAYALSDFGPL